MTIHIAINGFGRISRNVPRTLYKNDYRGHGMARWLPTTTLATPRATLTCSNTTAHMIVSMARIGIESGLMTTIHFYTNDQNMSDVYHSDLYRARSATQSIIPAKTGAAAAAIGKVIPELVGKLDELAARVPTIDVAMVDSGFIAVRDTTSLRCGAHTTKQKESDTMLRRTKIVATLGPATDSPESLSAVIAAGVDVTRLNFSHGSAEDHIGRARRVRESAEANGRFVALLADLQGPKLRIARFSENKVTLKAGQTFVLDAAMDKEAGNDAQVGIDYEQLIKDVKPGDILVLDDGRIEMEVETVDDTSISSRVLIGGPLSNNKGLNKRGGGLSAEALTEKDKQDIKTVAKLGADYVAVSFVRTAEDMQVARRLLKEAGSEARLVAKIERAELAHNTAALDSVIEASDAVMVARGDLAVEIGDAELVGVQKHIIARARTLDTVVITATQMMESMIENPMPTRAEVSDVANAVMDYTDAVMLSAETAVGDYPVEAVKAMVRICIGAEKQPSMHQSKHRIHENMEHIDEAIALSAMYAANHLQGVTAIICMSETGATPLLMSRIKSSLPIFTLSRHHSTQHRVTMFRGVQTVPFDSTEMPPEQANSEAVAELVRIGVVKEGDLVVITKGDYVNAQGGTNTMKIVRVGADIR